MRDQDITYQSQPGAYSLTCFIWRPKIMFVNTPTSMRYRVFFSSTNTNITISQKVINPIFIGLKHFKEETHRYKMVKTE